MTGNKSFAKRVENMEQLCEIARGESAPRAVGTSHEPDPPRAATVGDIGFGAQHIDHR